MEIHLYGTLSLIDGAGLGQYLLGHAVAAVGLNDFYIHVGGWLSTDGLHDTSRLLVGYNSRLMLMAGRMTAPLTIYSPMDGLYVAPPSGAFPSYEGATLWFAYAGATQATKWQLPANATYHFTCTAVKAYNQLGGSPPRSGWFIPDTTTVIIDAATVSHMQNSDNGVARFDWTGNGLVKFTGCTAFTPSLAQMGNIEFSGGSPVVTPVVVNTTLSGNGGSITSGATSMLVASSTGFPAGITFYAKIDSEIVQVTNVTSLTWTIVRAVGYDGGEPQ